MDLLLLIHLFFNFLFWISQNQRAVENAIQDLKKKINILCELV